MATSPPISEKSIADVPVECFLQSLRERGSGFEAENFPVEVPDDCEFATDICEPGIRLTTVTVMKKADGSSDFAVGSEKIATSNYVDRIENIARMIDVSLKDLPSDRRVVTLRIDRDVDFSQAQYALAGIAASSATDIQLAVLKDNHTNSQ